MSKFTNYENETNFKIGRLSVLICAHQYLYGYHILFSNLTDMDIDDGNDSDQQNPTQIEIVIPDSSGKYFDSITLDKLKCLTGSFHVKSPNG